MPDIPGIIFLKRQFVPVHIASLVVPPGKRALRCSDRYSGCSVLACIAKASGLAEGTVRILLTIEHFPETGSFRSVVAAARLRSLRYQTGRNTGQLYCLPELSLGWFQDCMIIFPRNGRVCKPNRSSTAHWRMCFSSVYVE